MTITVSATEAQLVSDALADYKESLKNLSEQDQATSRQEYQLLLIDDLIERADQAVSWAMARWEAKHAGH